MCVRVARALLQAQGRAIDGVSQRVRGVRWRLARDLGGVTMGTLAALNVQECAPCCSRKAPAIASGDADSQGFHLRNSDKSTPSTITKNDLAIEVNGHRMGIR